MRTSRIGSRQKSQFKVIDKATGFSLNWLEKLVLNTWSAHNSSPLLAFFILKLVPDKFDMPVRLWSKCSVIHLFELVSFCLIFDQSWLNNYCENAWTRDTDIIYFFLWSSQKEDIESEYYLGSVSCKQW